MSLDMRELRLHTLRGDIQSCGMDGLSKSGVKQVLFRRYVHSAEIPITSDEFNRVLDTEYEKVQAWRKSNK